MDQESLTIHQGHAKCSRRLIEFTADDQIIFCELERYNLSIPVIGKTNDVSGLQVSRWDRLDGAAHFTSRSPDFFGFFAGFRYLTGNASFTILRIIRRCL